MKERGHYKGKSPKQDLTIELPEGPESPYHN